jgi:hypothetical protein
MSVGLTLNGGTLVAQNRDERRDKQLQVVDGEAMGRTFVEFGIPEKVAGLPA